LEIALEDVGRRFNQDWIFKGINYRFVQGGSYAILGPNGSGKSTFLQLLTGNLSCSKGHIFYQEKGKPVDIDRFFNYFSLAAPYMELIEEFTLAEMIDFHFSFKPIREGLKTTDVLGILGLTSAQDRYLRYFSSGMKQRTKLVLACCANVPVLFLDEPTANLDEEGISWYLDLIRQYAADKLVVVCSNQAHEYPFCTHQIRIMDYK